MDETTDLILDDHGTLVLVHPASERGRDWLGDNCPEGRHHTYFGGSLVVESRYAGDLIERAAGDGLVLGS